MDFYSEKYYKSKGTIKVTLSNLYCQNGHNLMDVLVELGGHLLDHYESPYKKAHEIEYEMKCKYKGFKIVVVREDA